MARLPGVSVIRRCCTGGWFDGVVVQVVAMVCVCVVGNGRREVRLGSSGSGVRLPNQVHKQVQCNEKIKRRINSSTRCVYHWNGL
jgi:hypothetical protein